MAEPAYRAQEQPPNSAGAGLTPAPHASGSAVHHVQEGRRYDATGLTEEAIRSYQAAILAADREGNRVRINEALRCLALAYHRRRASTLWDGQKAVFTPVESADLSTYGHCARVSSYSSDIAELLGVNGDELLTIRVGAYLHDVGKVRVPHEILDKPGRLSAAEMAIVQQHPEWGVEMLNGIGCPWDIVPMIRWHHEKHDGSGYPDGLRGDAIPIAAQIVCIADVYDAITSNRSYRAAMTPLEAQRELHDFRHWWRTDVFDAFMATQGH